MNPVCNTTFGAIMGWSFVFTLQSSAAAAEPDFERCTAQVHAPWFGEDGLAYRTTAQLKRAILAVAECARSQVELDSEDNSPEVAAALDPLVDELARRQASVGLLEKVAKTTGVWRNVWNNLPGVTAVADQAFQVFTPDGYYFNISKNVADDGSGRVVTNFLRGRYVPNNNGEVDIFFTKRLSILGFPAEGTPLTPLARLAETGLLDAQNIASADEFLEGGEFASGELRTVYIDRNLRIIRGDRLGSVPLATLFVQVRYTPN